MRPSTPGRACPSVAPHPMPRINEEGRVTDEVVKVVEPTIGIVGSPLVQLGLDPQYPRPRPRRRWATVRRCSPATSWHSSSSAAVSLSPFAMWPAFPTSDYYEDSVPSQGHQLTTSLPAAGLAGRRGGQPRDGSHVHHRPVDGVGAQLFPCSLATSTPQAFPVASKPAATAPTRSRHRPWPVVHCCPAHIRQVGAGVSRLRGFHHWFTRVTPSRLACRTRTVWRCRPVPSLSGLLPPDPAPPGSGCPQLQRPAATGRRRAPSSRPVIWRLVAHGGVEIHVGELDVIKAAGAERPDGVVEPGADP